MTRTALKQRIREIWHKLEHVDARPDQLWDVLQKSWDVYAAMFVGSIIIATPVTLLTYWIVKRLAGRWSKNESQPSN